MDEDKDVQSVPPVETGEQPVAGESKGLFRISAQRKLEGGELGEEPLLPETGEQGEAVDGFLKQFGIDRQRGKENFPFGRINEILTKIKNPELRDKVRARFAQWGERVSGEMPGKGEDKVQPEEAKVKEGEKSPEEERLETISQEIADKNLEIGKRSLETSYLEEFQAALMETGEVTGEVQELQAKIVERLKTGVIKAVLTAACYVDSLLAARNLAEFGIISRKSIELFNKGWEKRGDEIEKGIIDRYLAHYGEMASGESPQIAQERLAKEVPPEDPASAG